jgi:DNA-binding beta-propeller fold protein YncE
LTDALDVSKDLIGKIILLLLLICTSGLGVFANNDKSFKNTNIFIDSNLGKAVTKDSGEILLIDKKIGKIYKVNNLGEISDFVGAGILAYADGIGKEAKFRYPHGIAKDSYGNIFVTDTGNNCIRKISKEGQVVTFAGSKQAGFVDGLAAKAQFNSPTGIAVDSKNNLYVVDQRNHSVRKIDQEGLVTTVTGDGRSGHFDGKLNEAHFYYPEGIAVDKFDNLYVVDKANNLIRKIDLEEGLVSTLTGNVNPGYHDGPLKEGVLSNPSDLVFDNEGHLYIADTGNNLIRKINLKTQEISTLALSEPLDNPYIINLVDDEVLFVNDISEMHIKKVLLK